MLLPAVGSKKSAVDTKMKLCPLSLSSCSLFLALTHDTRTLLPAVGSKKGAVDTKMKMRMAALGSEDGGNLILVKEFYTSAKEPYILQKNPV